MSVTGTGTDGAPTWPSLAPCLPPSRTLRAASGGGLRPSLTAAAPDARGNPGRDEETAPFNRTKKHQWKLGAADTMLVGVP